MPRLVLACLSLATFAACNALGQQATSQSCSPAGTKSLKSERQLPVPQEKFGGVIERDARDSKPCWAPRIVPPKSAPNVLLIMTDDAGYGVSSTFGGVIPTPALDRIAKNGLR
jgi:arylsulfatase